MGPGESTPLGPWVLASDAAVPWDLAAAPPRHLQEHRASLFPLSPPSPPRPCPEMPQGTSVHLVLPAPVYPLQQSLSVEQAARSLSWGGGATSEGLSVQADLTKHEFKGQMMSFKMVSTEQFAQAQSPSEHGRWSLTPEPGNPGLSFPPGDRFLLPIPLLDSSGGSAPVYPSSRGKGGLLSTGTRLSSGAPCSDF